MGRTYRPPPGNRNQFEKTFLNRSEVSREARDRQCYGIVPNVLRRNSRALAFFQRAGTVALDDRAIFLIPANALRRE